MLSDSIYHSWTPQPFCVQCYTVLTSLAGGGLTAFSREIREAGRIVQGPAAGAEPGGSPAILNSAPALAQDTMSVSWAVLEIPLLHLAAFL